MIGMGQPNNSNWHAGDAESPADVQSMMLDASTTEIHVEGLDDSWRASPWSSSMMEDRDCFDGVRRWQLLQHQQLER